jgi:transcriptional regulator with XRE-family HTH domain
MLRIWNEISTGRLWGDRIKRAREARGMSQADLAEHFKYKPAAVSAWETGRTEASVFVLTELAALLNVPFSWLADVKDKYSLDAELVLVPMDDREFAFEQAKRVIKKWAEKH